jgi:REP element-mobilizing transposase RayT
MANTFTCLQYHIVFSTKHREPWICLEIQERVWACLGGIARENDLKPLLLGGVDDRVHLLLGLPPTARVSEVLKAIKGGSSRWIKETLPGCASFGWQDGYAAFTVSKSQVSEVGEYIRNQREHHRVKTFHVPRANES